ncbi:MAG: sigma 54-interacting transcriptional regulator, partial [Sandaracinaceae bacterium]|nr:sigma 54-interacting transcriptional regulator [Sandaracinaceae bacterium]
ATAKASAPATAAAARGLGEGGRRLLALVRGLLLEGDEPRILERALDEALALSGAERAFLLRRRGKGRPHVAIARNLDVAELSRGPLRFSRSVAERVLSEGTAVVTAHAAEDPRLAGAASILDLGLRSISCVPVRGPSGVLGALYLDHRSERERFDEATQEIVQSLADVMGLALENARLHREAKERARDLERASAALRVDNERRAAAIADLERALAARGGPIAETAGIIGRAPALLRVLDVARRVAPSDLAVLVTGESGTGKELVARYVHDASARRDGPFLAVNCGALPETLLESELFGHVRGAFTGASADQPGLFRAASGGTIFLDEIGEMPARMQTRLLRVLQEGEVRPVGGGAAVAVDVRVVAATNRALEEAIDAGSFRRDLYYRLAGVVLALPPLRERPDDLLPLADALLFRSAHRDGVSHKSLTPRAKAALLAHGWPGNVRELEQTLRRAALLADGEAIDAEDLGLGALAAQARKQALRAFDRELVERALGAAGGNRTHAARALGVSRVTLHRWIRVYGLA